MADWKVLPRRWAFPIQILRAGIATLLVGAVPMSAGAAGGPALPPAPAPPSATLRLSLSDAIARALAHNLGSLLAEARVREAAGEATLTRSSLLPQLAAGATGARQKISLEAYGFPVAPGESPLLGPFNVVDERVYLSQSLLDLSALGHARAAAAASRAAVAGAADARDTVAAICGGYYLAVIAHESRVAAARAQLATAEALDRRAADMRKAGTVPAIEELRASVQLARQRQRLISAENDLAKARLTLLQAIGLPLDQPLELTDRLPYAAMPAADLQAALAEASADRPALQEAKARLASTEAVLQAARREAFPVVMLNADYGRIGSSLPSLEGTYDVIATLRLPLFESGRIRGEVSAARARADEARARLADLQRQVELEVRSALLDLESAGDRVEVARQATDVAAAELTQARDRFSAGVASNLEVVQAQESVATASEDLIASQYAYNLARIDLARAEGVAASEVPALSGGQP
jgi:outer membrane protein TolC